MNAPAVETLPRLVPPLLRPLARFDAALLAGVQRWRSDTTDLLSKQAKRLGDGRYTLPPTLALFLFGQYAGIPHLRESGLLAMAGFLLAGTLGQILQGLTRRHRPCSDSGPLVFEGPAWVSPHRSFPSGHTTVAWGLLSVYGLQYWSLGWVPALAFGLAVLTAWSRLNDKAHWPSDVLIGITLGLISAFAVTNIW